MTTNFYVRDQIETMVREMSVLFWNSWHTFAGVNIVLALMACEQAITGTGLYPDVPIYDAIILSMVQFRGILAL